MGRKQRHKIYTDCPVEAAMDIVGGKWKPVILLHLSEGTKRFNELRRLMPNTTQRMMTLQLRELEADGMVHREVYPQVPPKVEYSLTELGATLTPLLETLREWGTKYALTDEPQATAASAEKAAIPPPPPDPEQKPAPARPEPAEAKPGTPATTPTSGRPWGSTGSAVIK